MKNKRLARSRRFFLSISALGLLFIGVPVNADQVFLFSDNLSVKFDIDLSQTFAKSEFGRFYTADGSVSSAVVSKIVANPSRAIISARLDVNQNIPSSTRIIYYLSNNNGLKWTQVSTGFTYTFDSVGNQLRWRAVITRESPVIISAYVDSVNITYTVSDLIIPAPIINGSGNNNGPLNTVIYGAGGDLTSFVCGALSSIGVGCGAPQRVTTPVYGLSVASVPVSTSIPSQDDSQARSSQQASTTGSTGSLQASIANITAKRTASDDDVILVKVPGTNGYKQTLGLSTNDAVFEIIRGQKHFIPTVDIFFDYGFDLAAVQSVTQKDLEPFPRAKLVNVYKKGKDNFYITEGYMVRLIPNKRVFESYGDREEDIITISKKEFNFYPRNQYVFMENPLNADVYQIVDDGTKRYVVPQVMKRLRIEQYQIAPINKQQLDAYSNGVPIIF